MQGFELVPSNLGGWSLDKHHALNIRSGEYTSAHLLKSHTCKDILILISFCFWHM